MNIKYLLICFITISFASCNKKNNLQSCEWMLGNWQSPTSKGIFYESWRKNEANGFTGQGCFVNGTDTLFKEQLAVETKNGGVFYVATVPDQNQGKSIDFMLIAMGKELIFENPTHDFPKKISYQLEGNKLKAQISGDGKAIDYLFEKVSN